jgi:hypothetical protein
MLRSGMWGAEPLRLGSSTAERSHCAGGVELRSVAMERCGMCCAEPVRCETVTTVARCSEL